MVNTNAVLPKTIIFSSVMTLLHYFLVFNKVISIQILINSIARDNTKMIEVQVTILRSVKEKSAAKGRIMKL